MPIPNQPTLPEEGVYSDLERLFIEEQPPYLWPENQNSNLGALRKVLTSPLQDALTQILDMWNEMFVETSVNWLYRWEQQYGVPRNPTGVDLATRRAIVLSRTMRGAFTRRRRRQIIERFIEATFGTVIMLLPPGVPLPPEGVPIYAEPADVKTLYRVVETVEDFYYEVRILTPYVVGPGLARELEHFTPAGITFDINYMADLWA